MTDEEAEVPDDVPDDAGAEPGAEHLNPEEIAAAERKFLEAREAWFKDHGARGDHAE